MQTPEIRGGRGKKRIGAPALTGTIEIIAKYVPHSRLAPHLLSYVRFIGIDFGWISQPSGVAVLDLDVDRQGRRLGLSALRRLDHPDEVLSFVDEQTHTSPACWVGLDAPVLIRNAKSSRPADSMAHRLFSRQKAGCYPVNSLLPFAPRVLDFVAKLRSRGFQTTLPSALASPQLPQRHLFEVFPHAAAIRLFNLPEILPYKKGPLAGRRAALATFRALLAEGLSKRTPSFRCPSLPAIPASGKELKAVEDQLDAILCAYIAAHWFYWGYARNNVLGDESSGFIVVPSF